MAVPLLKIDITEGEYKRMNIADRSRCIPTFVMNVLDGRILRSDDYRPWISTTCQTSIFPMMSFKKLACALSSALLPSQ